MILRVLFRIHYFILDSASSFLLLHWTSLLTHSWLITSPQGHWGNRNHRWQSPNSSHFPKFTNPPALDPFFYKLKPLQSHLQMPFSGLPFCNWCLKIFFPMLCSAGLLHPTNNVINTQVNRCSRLLPWLPDFCHFPQITLATTDNLISIFKKLNGKKKKEQIMLFSSKAIHNSLLPIIWRLNLVLAMQASSFLPALSSTALLPFQDILSLQTCSLKDSLPGTAYFSSLSPKLPWTSSI